MPRWTHQVPPFRKGGSGGISTNVACPPNHTRCRGNPRAMLDVARAPQRPRQSPGHRSRGQREESVTMKRILILTAVLLILSMIGFVSYSQVNF